MHIKQRSGSILGAALVTVSLLMTACTGAADNSDADDDSAAGSSDAFPVTIEHRFGETILPEEPDRIVSLSPAATDELLSLGVVPVLTISQEWSGGEDGFNEWTSDALEELGAEFPPFLESNIVELDYEEILSYAPDLIIATAENFDETAYKRLAEIAPTLALRPRGEFTWRTSMEDVGAVVGEPEKAEEVVARAEAVVAGIQQAHPEFEGKTFVMSRALLEGNTSMFAYAADTSMPRLLSGFGLTPAPVSERRDAETQTNDFSLEELDSIETDLWIGFLNNPEDEKRTLENPLVAAWQPFATGRYVMIADRQLTQALSLSAPLAIEWGAPRLADDIADAIANAEG